MNLSCVRPFGVELTVSCPFFFEKQNKKFSDFVDKQTGYKTKCMLTYPMMVEKECIGVVMALNKIGAPAFTAEDEQVKMHVFTPSPGNNI